MIEKLDIKLKIAKESEYNKKRADFIAGYKEYNVGGFFSSGYYEHKPVIGEAKWNSYYPEGFNSWQAENGDKLTSIGEQNVIDKLNEIIEAVNGITKLIDIADNENKRSKE